MSSIHGFIVSIVIHSHNSASFLEGCVPTVLLSDFPLMNIEIILIDDASTDESVATMKWLCRGSKLRLRIIRNKTIKGQIHNRNTGMGIATGKYILFLDPSSFLDKRFLRAHVTSLEADPTADACFAPIQRYDMVLQKCVSRHSNTPFDYNKALKGKNRIMTPLFNRKKLLDIGMFDTDMDHEGWEYLELWLRMGKMGRKMIFLDGPDLSFDRIDRMNSLLHLTASRYDMIIEKLKYKYAVGQYDLFEQDGDVENLPCTMFSQLYYITHEAGDALNKPFTEKESMVKAFNIHSDFMVFKFKTSQRIRKLRFDPLEIPLSIKIHDISFFDKGVKKIVSYESFHNGHESPECQLDFIVNDPAMVIDFSSDEYVSMDTVSIRYEVPETVTRMISEERLSSTKALTDAHTLLPEEQGLAADITLKEYGIRLPLPFASRASKKLRRVSVICHAYHTSLLDEFRDLLHHMPCAADLFFTTDTDEKKIQIEKAFRDWDKGKMQVGVFENRGRDIAPKLLRWPQAYVGYDHVLHIHTKISTHYNPLAGWRNYLLDNLIGTKETIEGVFEIFDTDQQIGMISPLHFHKLYRVKNWGLNFEHAAPILKKWGLNLAPEGAVDFPAGSMFWARPEALRPLLDGSIRIDDFQEEQGQLDGTLAHAIERLYFISAEKAGFKWVKTVTSDSFPEAFQSIRLRNRNELKMILPLMPGMGTSRIEKK
jgi:glycosyltransferase involved in cell wall biosynthesis